MLGFGEADRPAPFQQHWVGRVDDGVDLQPGDVRVLLPGGVRSYCGTFMVFHDYMRPAVRLAAFERLPVI